MPNMDFKAGRLHAGQAQGHEHLRLVQAKEQPGGGCRPERAHRRGGVKAGIVMGLQHDRAECSRGFHPRDQGAQQCFAGRALRLRDRQGGGENRHRGVADEMMAIVIIQGMGGRAVDQSGVGSRAFLRGSNDGRGAGGAGLLAQDAHQRFMLCRQRYREPVQHALFRDRPGRV